MEKKDGMTHLVEFGYQGFKSVYYTRNLNNVADMIYALTKEKSRSFQHLGTLFRKLEIQRTNR